MGRKQIFRTEEEQRDIEIRYVEHQRMRNYVKTAIMKHDYGKWLILLRSFNMDIDTELNRENANLVLEKIKGREYDLDVFLKMRPHRNNGNDN